MADFTHLHLHTQYSFLDGAIHMKDLVPRISELGMDACAITEHGNLYGAIDFYRRARSADMKPILGCEVNVSPHGMADRAHRGNQHLILLAKDATGWRNLMYLVSLGHVEGFYYKPRIDKALLKERSEGLIALSGCLGGEIPRAAKDGDIDTARLATQEMKSIFAPDHFFLELQDNGIPEQTVANDCLKQLAKDEAVPLVATNNCHYVFEQDAPAHDILMCIKDGKTRDDPSRWRRQTKSLFIRSPEEMLEVFSDVPEAVSNTMRIRDMIDLELKLGQPMLPTFVPEDGSNLENHLRARALAGLEARFTELSYPVDRDEYKARLERELGIIIGMKFPGYFLIVADFIIWAKKHQISVGPGRGSGAGSLVAYALRITDLDPLPYNLLFERFLNPERVSMPDFDVDFCQERRGEVIEYVCHKYGEKNVGQIATFAQMKAKSVIKDVARALEVEFTRVNGITKLLPDTFKDDKGSVKSMNLDMALQLEPRLGEMADEFRAEGKDIIGIARKLEGLYRQSGMHAAGIVIADSPLWDWVPVCKGKDGELVAQFSMTDVEAAGLVKFDFLGLKTLDVIDHAEHHVNRRIQKEIAGKDLDALWRHPHVRAVAGSEQTLKSAVGDGTAFALRSSLDEVPEGAGQLDLTLRTARLPLDDHKVFQLVSSGATVGVFQLESTGFQKLLKQLRPDCFEDIVAAVALYRPGPLQTGMVSDFIDCKHGRKSVTYPHPLLEEVLKPTYGGFVYQEQVMQAAQVMAGYSLGGADLLRRAMGKKKMEVMAAERVKFVAGCEEKSISNEHATAVFDLMEKFAGYGFNKSHSAAYALVTYGTAYLKAYYPVEFMAALLSTELNSTDNIVKYIAEAKSMGVEVLPPTVNESEISFSVPGEAIRFGLGAIKGLGEAALDAILAAREAEGAFKSLYDFCERVSLKHLNKKALETLVRSGAFDEFGRPRAQLFAAIENAIEAAKSTQRDKASGQASLFGAVGLASAVGPREVYDPSIGEWPERERLALEKQSIGFYVTGHPLDRYAADLERMTNTTISNLDGLKPNSKVVIGASVSVIRERPLRDGSGRMAFVGIEDRTGAIEMMVGTKEFALFEATLKSDEPLLVTAAVGYDRNTETPTVRLRLRDIATLASVRAAGTKAIEIALDEDQVNPDLIDQIKKVLLAYHGECRVGLLVRLAGTEVELELPQDASMAPSETMVDELEALLGVGAVRFA